MLEALKDYVRELWEEIFPNAGLWINPGSGPPAVHRVENNFFSFFTQIGGLGKNFGQNPQHSYLLAFCATKFPKSYKPSECL